MSRKRKDASQLELFAAGQLVALNWLHWPDGQLKYVSEARLLEALEFVAGAQHQHPADNPAHEHCRLRDRGEFLEVSAAGSLMAACDRVPFVHPAQVSGIILGSDENEGGNNAG